MPQALQSCPKCNKSPNLVTLSESNCLGSSNFTFSCKFKFGVVFNIDWLIDRSIKRSIIKKCDFDESILKMNLDADDEPKEHVYHWPNLGTYPCSSLVEGDEQLDWPNYGMMPCTCIIIFWGLTLTEEPSAWADTAFISFY